LIQELEIHQIELEIQQAELETQNSVLAQSKHDLEVALAKITELYDFAPIGYLSLDRAGIICEINQAGSELLGCERSALLGRRFALFLAPNDRLAFVGFLELVLDRGTRERWEVSLVRDGRPPLEAELEGAASRGGGACQMVLTDISERKRAAENQLVLGKLESTGILAGGIAHDFNNLLAGIILNLDMARTTAPGSRDGLRYLDEAKRTAFLASGLTKQLLTFARGGAPLLQATALPPLIHESVRLALSGSRVRSEISLADDLWPVTADDGQIGQVVRNIVLNAREALPVGGVISVSAENVDRRSSAMPSLPPGGYVRVSIIDHGVGIAPEDLPKIFDPYFSTKQRGARKGMGLGLTICHTIIQAHGGAIQVRSVLGEGSTFEFYLPVATEAALKPASAPALAIPAHRRILVMDDDATLRDACGRTLRTLGHEVEEVAHGERAIAAFAAAQSQARPFDVVLLDLTIRDGMGGAETLSSLRRMDPGVKAIVMSGYAHDPSVADHRGQGFDGALVKPFDTTRMLEALAVVLAGG
jgi:PAS domain S-box-containing protein